MRLGVGWTPLGADAAARPTSPLAAPLVHHPSTGRAGATAIQAAGAAHRVFAAIAAVLCVVFFSADAVLSDRVHPYRFRKPQAQCRSSQRLQRSTTTHRSHGPPPSQPSPPLPQIAQRVSGSSPGRAPRTPAASQPKPQAGCRCSRQIPQMRRSLLRQPGRLRPSGSQAPPAPPRAAGAAAPQPAAAAKPREEAPPVVATLGPLGTVAPYQRRPAAQPPPVR